MGHVARHDAHGVDDQVARHQGRHGGERDVDGCRHHGQRRRPQQHHRLRLDPEQARGELAHEFGLPGVRVADFVQHLLGDGQGDDGGGLARGDKGGAAFDRGDRAMGVGRIGTPGLATSGAIEGKNGKRLGEHRGRGLRRRGGQRQRQAERGGGAATMVEIGDQDERRGIAGEPGFEGDLEPDAGGVAAGQREKRHRRSMTAAARISLNFSCVCASM